jgi:hypothetical protein
LRYFFHIFSETVLADDTGTELPDLQIAEDEAVMMAGQILRDRRSGALWKGTPFRMQITDSPTPGHGQTFFTLHFTACEPGASDARKSQADNPCGNI